MNKTRYDFALSKCAIPDMDTKGKNESKLKQA